MTRPPVYAEQRVAFVDDSGGTSLNLQAADVGTYFVVAAVIVTSEDQSATSAAVDAVRAKHFGRGEMKSSGVGGDTDRRLRVLDDLIGLKWLGYVLAVDKREIPPDSGLIYKRPFLKFLHRQLYARLYSTFSRLQVVADEHGSRDFMEGFGKYVEGHFEPTLFDLAEFEFRASDTEPLLQLADFVAGSVARVVDPTKNESNERRSEIFTLLRPNLSGIEEWPPRHRRLRVAPTEPQTPHDEAVEALSLSRATGLIEGLEGNQDLAARARRAVLKYLLFAHQFEGDPYVTTSKLVRLAAEETGFNLSTQQFRARVIAPLRDAGLILASSAKGYKLPAALKDVLSFVEHDLTILRPLIARLATARRTVLLGTANEVDIVADERYRYLRLILAVEEGVGAMPLPGGLGNEALGEDL